MDWQNFRLSTRLQLSGEVIEVLYSRIAEIDAVKNTFRLTHTLLPQTIERLTQSVIVTSTGASNRIEGNKLSDDEVEALYKSMRIKSLKTRDEQEVAGYLETLQTVFDSYESINAIDLVNNSFNISNLGRKVTGRYQTRIANLMDVISPQNTACSILKKPYTN